MTRVRRDLIEAAIAGLVALAGLVLASFGQVRAIGAAGERDPASATELALALGGAVVLLVAGAFAVRALAAAVRDFVEERTGDRGRAVPFRLMVSLIGYFLLLLTVLGVLDQDIQGLLLGGAITGVVVGIAAQQTIGNFFAGVVLAIARPFTVGDEILLRSGALGGEYRGVVTDMTVFYVNLMTDEGAISLPNSGVLAAAIGPGAASAEEATTESPREPP